MYLWNLFDPKKRFWIATLISREREIAHAQRLFRQGKKITKIIPKEIITDSLVSYPQAIRYEFPEKDPLSSLYKTKHTRAPSLAHSTNNNRIERLHNEINENTKTMRGMGNIKSAEMNAEGLRLYHNFIRSHSSLQNKTPAEVAGLDLNLGDNRLHTLIKLSGKKYNQDHKFKRALGKRLRLIDIVDEPNYIRVMKKQWLPKETWREINDILSVYGFKWKSDYEESSWVKRLGDFK